MTNDGPTLPKENPASVRGERRHVSILFADMVQYTSAMERLGEERSLAFVQALYDVLARCVREHDGTIHAFGGDSIMAVFGLSEASEDAALQACRAAMAVQAAFKPGAHAIDARFGIQPQMRVGISSGVAVVAPVDSASAALTTIGHAVNLASRIQHLAPAGGCLICDATYRLVEWQTDVVFDAETAIKGVAKPQKLWRLLSVHDKASRFDRSLGRGLSPLVGRDANLAALHAARERSSDGVSVIDIVGEPGLGKTRLIFEFLQSIGSDDVRVLQGDCAADGQQIPFLPFLEVARGAFGIESEDSPKAIARKIEAGLAARSLDSAENRGLLLNLLGLAAPPDALAGLDGVLIGLRTRDLMLELLKAESSASPMILVVEDVQWIDSASEEVLARIVAGEGPTNVLIVEARRPEYVPPWLDAPSVATQRLRPLGSDEVLQVARTWLGVDHLPQPLVQAIIERAGGNPLFSEEILGFLIDQGAVRVDQGEAHFDAAACAEALPASLLGLLAIRLDRLIPADRTLLQVAAAIGRRFDAGLLAAAAGNIDDVDAALRRLERQDFIAHDADGSAFAFKHVLMRDCVYHGLLPERRSALHLAIAERLEHRRAGHLVEAVETLAYHYAQTRRDDCAFRYAAMAGVKSLGTYSLDEATRFFASALALYEADPGCADDAQFAHLLADYALCLDISLSVNPMIDLADRVLPHLDRIGDNRQHALFLHHYVSCLVCNARYRDALDVQKRLSAMAERLGDHQAIAYALVSELSVSTYCAPMPAASFAEKSRAAGEALANLDDAYLRNFYLATIGWDQVCRGRIDRALETAGRLIADGTSQNDPRALGYGTAMRALIASIGDDYEQALELAERAQGLSRAKFEQIIASAARCGAIVSLGKPDAIDEVSRHLDLCRRNGWTMFQAGPELMLGVAQVMAGQIGPGLAQIEQRIARAEAEGFAVSADWGRLYLCEVYLAILSGRGGAPAGTVLRNAGAVAKVFLRGRRRVRDLVDKVCENTQFDPDGHNIGRAELVLGLLYDTRKQPELAARHLREARRIIEASGRSPLLDRIDTALAAVTAA